MLWHLTCYACKWWRLVASPRLILESIFRPWSIRSLGVLENNFQSFTAHLSQMQAILIDDVEFFHDLIVLAQLQNRRFILELSEWIIFFLLFASTAIHLNYLYWSNCPDCWEAPETSSRRMKKSVGCVKRRMENHCNYHRNYKQYRRENRESDSRIDKVQFLQHRFLWSRQRICSMIFVFATWSACFRWFGSNVCH